MRIEPRIRDVVTVCDSDVKIHSVVIGDGFPVICLPSLGRDVDDFYEMARELARHDCQVILPSPRSVGKSAGPLEGLSLHDFARDVAQIIEHLQCGPALIVGHAFGNWIARTCAVDYPELVQGVAVLAAAHKNFPAYLRDDIDVCMDIRAGEVRRLEALRRTFFAPGHDPSDWLSGWYPKLAAAQRYAGAATDKSIWWHAGIVPVLDVQASNDVFAPESGAHCLRDELGAARVQITRIDNAGHALLPEQPIAVASALLSFVNWLSTPKQGSAS